MATSRFTSLREENITQLLNDKDSENTKKLTKHHRLIFESYLIKEKNIRNPSTAVELAATWYGNMVVGENTLGKKMKVSSHQAEFSTIYTNHSIRATTITKLDRSGFESAAHHVGKRTQKRKQYKNLQQNRCKHKKQTWRAAFLWL